jgi:hypothetical protein
MLKIDACRDGGERGELDATSIAPRGGAVSVTQCQGFGSAAVLICPGASLFDYIYRLL